MENAFTIIGKYVVFIIAAAMIGMLLAFPIKWAWNYAIVHIFNMPVITWGHAWCLSFLASKLIQSSFSHNVDS